MPKKKKKQLVKPKMVIKKKMIKGTVKPKVKAVAFKKHKKKAIIKKKK